jgi:hypothetical protein
VVAVVAATEVHAIEVAHEREDAAADGDARLAFVPGVLPRLAERLDVASLDGVERVSELIVSAQGE